MYVGAVPKNIQVKSVPDDVHAVLRRRAAEAGMSLQEFLQGHLKQFADQPTLAETFARIKMRTGGRLSPEQALRFIHEERGGRL